MLKQLIRVIVALALFLPYVHASSYGNSTENYAEFDTATDTDGLLRNNIFLMKMVKDEDYSTHLPPLKHGIEDVTASANDTMNASTHDDAFNGSNRSVAQSHNNDSGIFRGNFDGESVTFNGEHLENFTTTENPDDSLSVPKLAQTEGKLEEKSHHVSKMKVENSNSSLPPPENNAADLSVTGGGSKNIIDTGEVEKTYILDPKSFSVNGDSLSRKGQVPPKIVPTSEIPHYSVSSQTFAKIEPQRGIHSQFIGEEKPMDSIAGTPFVKNISEGMDSFSVNNNKSENVSVVKIFEGSLAEPLHEKSSPFRGNNGQRETNSNTTGKSSDLVRGSTLVWNEAHYVNGTELISGVKDEDPSTGVVSAEDTTSAINSTDSDNNKSDLNVPSSPESDHNARDTFRRNQDDRKKNTTARNGLGSWPKFTEVQGQPEIVSPLISKEKMNESSATVASNDKINFTDISDKEIERVGCQKTQKNPLLVFLNKNGKILRESERTDKENFTTEEKTGYFARLPIVNITGFQIRNSSLPLRKIRKHDHSFDFTSFKNNKEFANESNIYSKSFEKFLTGKAPADLDKMNKSLKEGDSFMKNKTSSVDTTKEDPKVIFGIIMEVLYSATFAAVVCFLAALFVTLKKAFRGTRQS